MYKYTMELRAFKTSDILFNFEYNFYSESCKKDFEKKFFNHFNDEEIAWLEPEKFKHKLQTRLNEIYPYYKQLYETELRTKDIDFMLNKDLEESFTRNYSNDGVTSSTSEINSNSNSNGESISKSNDTPQNYIDDIDNYLSSASKDISKNQNSDTQTSSGNGINSMKGNETTKLISKGNIGITSSAELLEKWRNVIINIDMLIIQEFKDLFLQVY